MAEPQDEIFDAAVIGAGVVGCAVFRALVLAGLRTVLLERGADILGGASKGNSAILHTGFDAPPGSLELACMQAGRAEYLAIREPLGLPLLETDAVLVAWTAEEAAQLPAIRAKALRNGVPAVRPLAPEALAAREPQVARGAADGLLVPGEHVIDPWSAPLAYALQGLANGGTVRRRAAVEGGTLSGGTWRLATAGGPVAARLVVNCAGLQGDLVEAIARPSSFAIRPRKGQFVVFDKPAARLLGAILLPVPTERTKGVLLARTAFGNLLAGPTAEDQEDREHAATDPATLARLVERAQQLVPALAGMPVNAVYAGLRPATAVSDYIIEGQPARRWITVAGIRSTGLTAALGIAAHVRALVGSDFAALRPLADPAWTPVPNLAEDRPRPWQAPGAELVCHCELVTRAEIEAALAGPLPAGDVGGLKRRTRCMMGRCQGFYCSARVATLAGDRLLPPLAEAAA
ncbi:MAG: NAD(P)/FAD-dependent oxidoreductase [Dongiaceae bacterium]